MSGSAERLMPILTYSMNETEAKAFKLCLDWEDLTAELIPGQRHQKLPRKGDPRKSSLFRFCYKTVTERRGLVPDEELELYVRAQIEVVKHASNGQGHIAPAILCGDGAWRRWMVWRKAYQKKASVVVYSAGPGAEPLDRMVGFVRRSRDYLMQRGGVDVDFLRTAHSRGDLTRWVKNGVVSPYFIAVSTAAREALGDDRLRAIGVDPADVLPHLDPEKEGVLARVAAGEEITGEALGRHGGIC